MEHFLTHDAIDTNTFRLLLLFALTALSAGAMVARGYYRLWYLRTRVAQKNDRNAGGIGTAMP